MDYSILKQEVLQNSALTDTEIVSLLNDKTVKALRKVDYSDVIGYLTYSQKIVGIIKATTDASVEIRYLADTLRSFDLRSPSTNSSVNRLLDALIADGLITDTDKSVIVGMADYFISKAESLGLPEVKLGHVVKARSML